MRQYMWDIDRGLRRLDLIRTQAKDLALKTIKEIGKPTVDPLPQLNVLMESFLITPVDMDPSGIVSKFDHLLDVRDVKFKEDVQKMAPSADSAQVNNLENLVEASWALNTIFRIIRHFYLLGKKTNSIFIIIQLQALLPMIMQEAEAYLGAGRAFAEGQPIGDGLGPLVASKLMKDKSQRKVEKDIMVAETTMEDRRIIALKAEGPGGNVGKPGDAIQSLLQENRLNGIPRFSNIPPRTLGLESDYPPILHRRLSNHDVLLDFSLRLILHQLRRNKRSKPIAYRLPLSESAPSTQIRLSLLHYHWKESLELNDDEYTVRLLTQKIEVAYYSENGVQSP